MTKPVIGVTLSSDKSKLIWYMHKFAIWRAGGIAKKITPATGVLTQVDAFLLGGGDDIGLDISGSSIDPSVKYDRDRDALELKTLEYAFKSDKPVLGICRGSQMINIARGGTLYGDLSDFKKTLSRRRMVLPRRKIHIEENSLLQQLLNRNDFSINALHHQSVRKLGQGLKISARDTDDIVQAIECEINGKILGVQWHPELIPWSKDHQSLFRWLVKQSR